MSVQHVLLTTTKKQAVLVNWRQVKSATRHSTLAQTLIKFIDADTLDVVESPLLISQRLENR